MSKGLRTAVKLKRRAYKVHHQQQQPEAQQIVSIIVQNLVVTFATTTKVREDRPLANFTYSSHGSRCTQFLTVSVLCLESAFAIPFSWSLLWTTISTSRVYGAQDCLARCHRGQDGRIKGNCQSSAGTPADGCGVKNIPPFGQFSFCNET